MHVFDIPVLLIAEEPKRCERSGASEMASEIGVEEEAASARWERGSEANMSEAEWRAAESAVWIGDLRTIIPSSICCATATFR